MEVKKSVAPTKNVIVCVGMTCASFALVILNRWLFLHSRLSESANLGEALALSINIVLGSEPGRWMIVTGVAIALIGLFLAARICTALLGIYHQVTLTSVRAVLGLWICLVAVSTLLSAFYGLYALVLVLLAAVVILWLFLSPTGCRENSAEVYVKSHFRRRPKRG